MISLTTCRCQQPNNIWLSTSPAYLVVVMLDRDVVDNIYNIWIPEVDVNKDADVFVDVDNVNHNNI